MASEDQANPNRRRPPRPAIAGIVVLLVVGMAVALPVMMDPGCSAIKGGATANAEPMELWGRWLGMMLAGADSPTARNLGVPGVVAGVVVAEVARDGSSRAVAAGLAPGDVIVKVDGSSTQNLAELYTLTTRLNVARPLPLEVLRQGQSMVVTLPPPMDATPQQPMALQQPGVAPQMPQLANVGALPQVQALTQPQPVAQPAVQQPNPGMWPAAPAVMPMNNPAGAMRP
jgi:hypothetical protein